MWGQSLRELFVMGGPVMWPLLACSIIGSALVLERALVYAWLYLPFNRFSDQLKSRLSMTSLEECRKWLRDRPRPLAVVADSYLEHVRTAPALREQIVTRTASQQLELYEKRLTWLGIVVHVAPLLGLLGTVAGLVTAFHQIELQGGRVQAGDLAGGIWAALMTTVFGLSIALPCLAAHHLFERRLSKATLEMEWIVSLLEEWLADGSPGVTSTKSPPVQGRLSTDTTEAADASVVASKHAATPR